MLTDPSKNILGATVLSLALSIYLFFFMDSPDAKLYGIYVGLWVPSILGAYRVIQTGKTDGTDYKNYRLVRYNCIWVVKLLQ